VQQRRVLLDSNILIRWVEPEQPDQVIVAGALDRLKLADIDLCYTSQNLGEFWNTLTRPADRNGYGLTPAQADRRAHAIESRITLLPDTPDVHIEWRRLLVAQRVSGVQVHDARIVAAMHVHSVKRILTFNTRDFARFTDIEAIHPADLMSQPLTSDL
jgi:predicted nucleic acid-binding protein